MEENFQNPGNTAVKGRVTPCPNTLKHRALFSSSSCKLRLAGDVVVVNRLVTIGIPFSSPSSCSSSGTVELLSIHVFSQGLLIPQSVVAKPNGWHQVQFRNRPSYHSNISVHAVQSPLCTRALRYKQRIPLGIYRLEIWCESDCFPGICS